MSALLHPGRRPDIDGLRAVSVVAVLGFHAFPQWVPWGFVGVDVFFVISGYLITTILLENLAAGRFTLAEFYERRIRRIFPALIVVLLATYAMGWHFLLGDEMRELGRHVAAGGGFVANLLLWSEHGYFDREAATKPLLHLWSLGIEEQFYIAWPLLLWAVRRHARLTIAACIALPIASFAFGAWATYARPVEAFYSPFSRVWELLAGGALALAMLRRPAWFARHADARSVLALAAFVAGAFLIHEKAPFPGVLALLPVAAAVLWISSGQATLNRRVLATRGLVAIGLISYPLYLWHWPLLVFAATATPGTPPLEVRVAILGISFVLAWATYRWVERPLRFGPHGRRKAAALAATMAVVVVAALALPIRSMPGLERPVAEQTAAWRERTCFLDEAQDAADFSRCPDRFAPHAVLLWGDSHAAQLAAAVRERLAPSQTLVQRTASACPPLVGIDIAAPPRPHCRGINDAVLAEVRAHRPEVVLMAAAWGRYGFQPDLRPTLDALRSAGAGRVVVIGPFPVWQTRMPQRLLQDMRGDPLRRIPERVSEGRVASLDAVEPALQQSAMDAGAGYLDVRGILCDSRGCLARTPDGALTTWDTQHVTLEGARLVARRLALEPTPTR